MNHHWHTQGYEVGNGAKGLVHQFTYILACPVGQALYMVNFKIQNLYYDFWGASFDKARVLHSPLTAGGIAGGKDAGGAALHAPAGAADSMQKPQRCQQASWLERSSCSQKWQLGSPQFSCLPLLAC